MKALPKSKAKTAYGLLSEIAKLIIDEPKRYDQHDWLCVRSERGGEPERGFPQCGTVGCVAGWVITLKGDTKTSLDVSNDAGKVLGLDRGAAYELFDGGAVDGAAQTKRHALYGVRHIRAFQKKYAKQLKAKAV